MKLPLLRVSTRVLLYLLGLFSLLNISQATPIHDGIPGIDSGVWRDMAVKKFYGPWSEVYKLNGEYADYNDYGARIQDSGPRLEVPVYDPEVVESGAADFQSNYGEFEGDDTAISFQSSNADDQRSVGNQNNGNEIIVDTDPENHDVEGNVQWTSAAT